MRAIFLIFLCTVSLARARLDPATGLVFPDRCSSWTCIHSQTYEPAALGCSYSYKPLLSAQGAITCYVYDKGMRALPDGAESKIVLDEMIEVFQGVTIAWNKQDAKVEVVSEPQSFRYEKADPVLALFCVHRIEIKGVANVSVSVLTVYQGNFVKLRYTHPGRDAEAALRSVGLFLYALYQENQSSVPVRFKPPFEPPNQALEPTAPAVTPRADARVAPACAVAHL